VADTGKIKLNPKGGSYAILVRLKKSVRIEIGRKGRMDFAGGWYVYCGSAKTSVLSRVNRHKQKEGKKLRWHIDYLLDHPLAALVLALGFFDKKTTECSLVRRLGGKAGGMVIQKGFGSSDCREKCGAHLVYFSKKPDLGEMLTKGKRL